MKSLENNYFDYISRSIDAEYVAWKKDPDRLPILLNGARRAIAVVALLLCGSVFGGGRPEISWSVMHQTVIDTNYMARVAAKTQKCAQSNTLFCKNVHDAR